MCGDISLHDCYEFCKKKNGKNFNSIRFSAVSADAHKNTNIFVAK